VTLPQPHIPLTKVAVLPLGVVIENLCYSISLPDSSGNSFGVIQIHLAFSLENSVHLA
jgi:hypothetical protein